MFLRYFVHIDGWSVQHFFLIRVFSLLLMHYDLDSSIDFRQILKSQIFHRFFSMMLRLRSFYASRGSYNIILWSIKPLLFTFYPPQTLQSLHIFLRPIYPISSLLEQLERLIVVVRRERCRSLLHDFWELVFNQCFIEASVDDSVNRHRTLLPSFLEIDPSSFWVNWSIKLLSLLGVEGEVRILNRRFTVDVVFHI